MLSKLTEKCNESLACLSSSKESERETACALLCNMFDTSEEVMIKFYKEDKLCSDSHLDNLFSKL